jgi:hypothetical protein
LPLLLHSTDDDDGGGGGGGGRDVQKGENGRSTKSAEKFKYLLAVAARDMCADLCADLFAKETFYDSAAAAI